ncbi:hypothetical protein ACJW31_08G102300 [Castanea mollissima]
MTSYCYRITAGAGLSNRPIRLSMMTTSSSRTVEISRLPQNYCSNSNHHQQRSRMVLRPRKIIRAAAVVGPCGDGEDKAAAAAGPCAYAVEDLSSLTTEESESDQDRTAEMESEEEEENGEKKKKKMEQSQTVKVAVAAAVTVVMGVGNRVMYKLALVPLKQYPFFLAQLATFGYVIVYFSILYLRYHAGIVTDEMLSLPKAPFLAVGLLEALGAATGMAAGAILSGASIPILSQTFLVWQIILSTAFLGRRYRVNQLLGCFLVAIGVIITVASGSSAGHSLKEAGIFWSVLMVVSFLFQAADTVLKEVIFSDAAQRLKGGSVDLFVVNSYGSAFQAFFICLLLPFLSKLWGIPFSQLPNYLKDGAACFLNVGTLSSGCDGAPLLPLLFIVVNMGYNISLLYLLKISSAVVSCLASTFSGFVAGAIILVMGLLIYAWTPSVPTSASPSLPN